MTAFLPGQRWVSDSEPDLGLGIIMSVSGRQLEIEFRNCGEVRTYAFESAPLSRVRFAVGDKVPSESGKMLKIAEVVEAGGIVMYRGKTEDGKPMDLHEADLASHIQFNSPEDRLFSGQLSEQRWFDLRFISQKILMELAASPVQGMLGPRVALIPHQLSVSHDVSDRRLPRVLLSDEVGLGKTIEAGLILHRLLTLGRVDRVLILLPESLMHQWLVEMLRRFNLHFSLYDEERYLAQKEPRPKDNPFLEDQLVLCSQDVFFSVPSAREDVLAAGWDLLIVDEAHHLEWNAEAPSEEYVLVEQLAQRTGSVLLLTATPEQLGVESHFARLRMLDPDRFHDYDMFLKETGQYRGVASAVNALEGNEPLDVDHMLILNKLITEKSDKALLRELLTGRDDDEADAIRETLIGHLIDRHGTGRIVFRNTRANISGFPDRVYHPVALEGELCEDGGEWWKQDARIAWLIDLLEEINPDKVLLICHDRRTAKDIVEALRQLRGIPAAAFHEGLTIIERDRAGAWFAEMENGAQLLACSEIGSEGRNFQFAHHLVLFDLPSNPDLLEQRIGRLDRIGQKERVKIHVPFLEGSRTDLLQQWYHDGLNAFEHSCAIGAAVMEKMEMRLNSVLDGGMDLIEVASLIEETRTEAEAQRERMEAGRDRLLELNSHHPERAAKVMVEMQRITGKLDLLGYLDHVFDCFGIESEEHSRDALIIRPADNMFVSAFPGLPEDGMTATVSREIAQSRDDFQYLTWEHPLVTNALDMAVSGDQGMAVVSAAQIRGVPAGTVIVEGIFTLQSRRVTGMNMRRFLPESHLRCVWDYKRRDYTQHLSAEVLAAHCENVERKIGRQLIEHQRKPLKEILASMSTWAREQQRALIDEARENVHRVLDDELGRLESLQRTNPNVRDDELEQIRHEIAQAERALDQSEMKLDAVRVVFVH